MQIDIQATIDHNVFAICNTHRFPAFMHLQLRPETVLGAINGVNTHENKKEKHAYHFSCHERIASLTQLTMSRRQCIGFIISTLLPIQTTHMDLHFPH